MRHVAAAQPVGRQASDVVLSSPYVRAADTVHGCRTLPSADVRIVTTSGYVAREVLDDAFHARAEPAGAT
jgi:hypothetical protein